jgi:hypothetical protein
MTIICARRYLIKLLVIQLSLLMPHGANAHYSDAGLDAESVVVLEGTVTNFVWNNPHIYFTMQLDDDISEVDDGDAQSASTWGIQMASIPPLSRRGWRPDSLKAGDRVVARVHPALDGRTYGLFVSVEKGANLLPMGGATENANNPSAESLEGVWRGDRSTMMEFTSFFDRLETTDKGTAAREQFDALSAMNPMSSCSADVARPTPATLVSAGFYLEEIEFVDTMIILRNEIFDAERVVYMDGRVHPDNLERTVHGHSIGRWEDGVLVVDTVGFADHRSPYQNGIPSGAEKHVVERYRLSADGTRVIVDLMLEDSEYLVGALTDTMEWIYAPDQRLLKWNCDQQTARNFLPE